MSGNPDERLSMYDHAHIITTFYPDMQEIVDLIDHTYQVKAARLARLNVPSSGEKVINANHNMNPITLDKIENGQMYIFSIMILIHILKIVQ